MTRQNGVTLIDLRSGRSGRLRLNLGRHGRRPGHGCSLQLQPHREPHPPPLQGRVGAGGHVDYDLPAQHQRLVYGEEEWGGAERLAEVGQQGAAVLPPRRYDEVASFSPRSPPSSSSDFIASVIQRMNTANP